MYLIGTGHEHMGPGTSMVQRIDWAQDQERQLMNAARGLGSVPEFANDVRQMTRYRGMGCGCGRNCGLGLFEAGLDFSQWGAVEWTLLAVGGFALLSTVSTTQRGAARVRKSFKRYARRRAITA